MRPVGGVPLVPLVPLVVFVVLVVGVVGISAPAAAAPLTVTATAPLLAGDAVVGSVRDVDVTPTAWSSSTRFSFSLPVADGAAVVTADVDLAVDGTFVDVGVCAVAPLAEPAPTSDGFRLEVLPGTRARVVARAGGGLVVDVPAPTPNSFGETRVLSARALSSRCATGPTTGPTTDPVTGPTTGPTTDPVTGPATGPATTSAPVTCAPFRLRARADDDGGNGLDIVDARAVVARARAGGGFDVAVDDFNGFRWHGTTTTAPRCAAVPPGGAGVGHTGVVVGAGEDCVDGVVPAGAALRAPAGARAFLRASRAFAARLCRTESPFAWTLTTTAGAGALRLRGVFDGGPRPATSW